MKKSMTRNMTFILIALALCGLLAGCGGGPKAAVTLLPKDAVLEYADGVTVEPDKEPYHLANWSDGDVVGWYFDIKEEGLYAFHIEYSRPGTYPSAKGLITLNGPDASGTEEFNFTTQPTGEKDQEDDWSVYTVNDSCGSRMKPGKYVLSLRPVFGEDYDGPDKFINLRSVKLIKSSGN